MNLHRVTYYQFWQFHQGFLAFCHLSDGIIEYWGKPHSSEKKHQNQNSIEVNRNVIKTRNSQNTRPTFHKKYDEGSALELSETSVTGVKPVIVCLTIPPVQDEQYIYKQYNQINLQHNRWQYDLARCFTKQYQETGHMIQFTFRFSHLYNITRKCSFIVCTTMFA